MNTQVTEEDLMEAVFATHRSPSSYRFSQRSSRSSSVSPRKRASHPGRTPDVVDDSSVDIYGDLSMDSIQLEPDDTVLPPGKWLPIQTSTDMGENSDTVVLSETSEKEKVEKCQSEEMDPDMGKNMDLYTDVLISDLSDKEKLQNRIKELKEHNSKLLSQNQTLQKCKEQLSKNISSLFKTAKSELRRKDQEISQLRKMIDDLKQAPRRPQISRRDVPKETGKPELFVKGNRRGDGQERVGLSGVLNSPSVVSKDPCGVSLRSTLPKCFTETGQLKNPYQQDDEKRYCNERDKFDTDSTNIRSRRHGTDSNRFLADSKSDYGRRQSATANRNRSRSPIGETNFDESIERLKPAPHVESRKDVADKASKISDRFLVSQEKAGKETVATVDEFKGNSGKTSDTVIEKETTGCASSVLEKSSHRSTCPSDVTFSLAFTENEISDKNLLRNMQNSEPADNSVKQKSDLDKTVNRVNSNKNRSRERRIQIDTVEAHKSDKKPERQNQVKKSPQKIIDLRKKLLQKRETAMEKDSRTRTEGSSRNRSEGEISERGFDKKGQAVHENVEGLVTVSINERVSKNKKKGPEHENKVISKHTEKDISCLVSINESLLKDEKKAPNHENKVNTKHTEKDVCGPSHMEEIPDGNNKQLKGNSHKAEEAVGSKEERHPARSDLETRGTAGVPHDQEDSVRFVQKNWGAAEKDVIKEPLAVMYGNGTCEVEKSEGKIPDKRDHSEEEGKKRVSNRTSVSKREKPSKSDLSSSVTGSVENGQIDDANFIGPDIDAEGVQHKKSNDSGARKFENSKAPKRSSSRTKCESEKSDGKNPDKKGHREEDEKKSVSNRRASINKREKPSKSDQSSSVTGSVENEQVDDSTFRDTNIEAEDVQHKNSNDNNNTKASKRSSSRVRGSVENGQVDGSTFRDTNIEAEDVQHKNSNNNNNAKASKRSSSRTKCELEKSEGKSADTKGPWEEEGNKSMFKRRTLISKREELSKSDLLFSAADSMEKEPIDRYDNTDYDFETESIEHKKSNNGNVNKTKNPRASNRSLSLEGNSDLIGIKGSPGNIDPQKTRETVLCDVTTGKEEPTIMKRVADRKSGCSDVGEKRDFKENSENGLSSKLISSPQVLALSTSQVVMIGQITKTISSPSVFENEDSGERRMEIEEQENEGKHSRDFLSKGKKGHHTELLHDQSLILSHRSASKRVTSVDVSHKSAFSDSQAILVPQNLQAKAHCNQEEVTNIAESSGLVPVKDVSSRGVFDKWSDSEITPVISENVSFHKEKSPTADFCHVSCSDTHIDAEDCFACYKESSNSNSQPASAKIDSYSGTLHTCQQRKGSSSYPTTFQNEAMTSVFLSNQDISSVASNGSLPFSNLTDESKNSDCHQERSSSQPLSPSNHTWPFKVSHPSHGPLPKKPQSALALSSSSSSSSSLSTSCHLQKADFNPSEIDQSKQSSKSADIGGVRAFPITKLQSCNTSCLSQPKLPTVIVTAAEEANLDTLDADPALAESSSEKSSNSQVIEGSSVASTETNSRPDNDTDTNSISAERQSCAGRNTFQSPISEQSSVDDANLSPPKIWRRNLYTTPSKSDLSPSLFSPQRRRSTNVMCTPNLIVLGDEETSSGTLISPCKPNLTPSDFYPPGVRMKPQEVSTRRHIRGEPELLHAGSDSQSEPVLGTKRCEKDSTDSDIKSDKNGEDINIQVETSETTSSETIRTVTEDSESKDSADMRRGIYSGKGSALVVTNYDEESIGKVGTEHESSSSEYQGSMPTIVQKAFERVFKKDYSTFKTEMAEKADVDHLLLRTALRQSMQSLQKLKPCTRLSVAVADGCQSLQTAAEDSAHTDGVAGRRGCDSVASRRSAKKSVDRPPNKSNGKVPSCSPENISGHDIDQNSDNVYVNDQEMKERSEASAIQSLSLCFKCQSAKCVCDKMKLNRQSGVSFPSEKTNEGNSCSDICLQSSGSQSQGAFATACKKERNVFRFSFFTGNSTKSCDVPISKKHGLEKQSRPEAVCREESTQSSVFSINRVSEDKMIHEIVSSLDTSWQEAIDKDFREQVGFNQPLSSMVPMDLSQGLPTRNQTTFSKGISFAGRIPSSLTDKDETDDDDVFEVRESVDVQTNSPARGQKRKYSRNEAMPTLGGHQSDKFRPSQKQSKKEGCCASPDTCAVTSSDVYKEDIDTSGLSMVRISPFDVEEPDSTCDPYPKCLKTLKKKYSEAEVDGVKTKPNAFQNLSHNCEEEEVETRPDLPDSPQINCKMRRYRNMETSNSPRMSRRKKLNASRKGGKTIPTGNLISLDRRLFPNDESDGPPEIFEKLHLSCGKAIDTKKVSYPKTKCADYDRGVGIRKDDEGLEVLSDIIEESESHHSIEESESYHSTSEDAGRCLNATFTVNEHLSDGDDKEGDVTLTQKSYERKVTDSSGDSTPFGSPDYPRFVEKRKKLPPTPQRAWTVDDELSLDAQSLSEFDQDVMRTRQSTMLNRINSRTASFSSLLSVGHDSPMSVSSPRFSTPGSQRSPRDALPSPFGARALDSCDEEALELEETIEDDMESVEGHQIHFGKGEWMMSSYSGEEKLSRHLAFQELKRLMLVKKYIPSCSSCGLLGRNEEVLMQTGEKLKSVQATSNSGDQSPFQHESKALKLDSSLGRSYEPKDQSGSKGYRQKRGDSSEKKSTQYVDRSQKRQVLGNIESPRQKVSNTDSEQSFINDQTAAKLLSSGSLDYKYSKPDVCESPNKRFRSKKDMRNQPEESPSSEDEDVKENACFHEAERNTLEELGLKPRANGNSKNSKRLASRKSVKIVEDSSSMEIIIAGSPPSEDENHFILKRLQGSPLKNGSKSKLSSLPQSQVSVPACRNTPEESLSNPQQARVPNDCSGGKQPAKMSDRQGKETSSHSPLNRTSVIPEADQEVLSWARAHQKNVDRVKLKLNTRLNDFEHSIDDSEHSADDSEQSAVSEEQDSADDIEHEKATAMQVNGTNMSDEYVFQVAEHSEEVNESEDIDGEGEKEGACADYEEGEITEDSDNDGGSGISEEIQPVGEPYTQSSNRGSLDKCGPTNPDKTQPMSMRTRQKFVVGKCAKSNSGPRNSPLAEVYRASPSKSYGNVPDRNGSRRWKRPQSLSPDGQISCSRSQGPNERRENRELRNSKRLCDLRSKEDIDDGRRRLERRRRDSLSKGEGRERVKIKEKVPPRTDRHGGRNSAERPNPPPRSQRRGSLESRRDGDHRRDRRSRSGSDTRRDEERQREREPVSRDYRGRRGRRNVPRDRRRRSLESDRRRY